MVKRDYSGLIGAQFSRLTILEIVKSKRTSALCLCVCGKEIITRIDCLESGNTKSCGCIRELMSDKVKTHGLTNHPLYKIFYSIKERCYNKNKSNYRLYGGKGVRVCEEWLNNPESFIKWALLNKWVKGKQIDKDIIPNNLGIPAILYSPEMCSVVDPVANNNNKSNTPFITWNNETHSLMEWSRKFGIHPATLRNRLNKKWPPEKMFITEKYKYRI